MCMTDKKFTSAIILAAGIGSRMRSDTTKQRMTPLGVSVLLRAAMAFDKAVLVDELVVVCREEELDFARAELSSLSKPVRLTVGGKTRRDSAECGFLAVSESAELVAIHDVARCLINPEEIDAVIAAAASHGAASAVGRVTDTVKTLDSEGFITSTIPRDTLRVAQTPQVFSREIYEKAIEASRDTEVTDDNMMAELIGVRVLGVEIGSHNFKITTREDLELAEFILARRGENELV